MLIAQEDVCRFAVVTVVVGPSRIHGAAFPGLSVTDPQLSILDECDDEDVRKYIHDDHGFTCRLYIGYRFSSIVATQLLNSSLASQCICFSSK